MEEDVTAVGGEEVRKCLFNIPLEVEAASPLEEEEFHIVPLSSGKLLITATSSFISCSP